jgi:HSP90 family molecular chaperone
MSNSDSNPNNQSYPFKAETHQILDILIHSLYIEREVFLRELISNAADALTRINFEMLTNRNIQSPESELAIWISIDPDQKLLTIRDTGVGMTEAEMIENLGTIAHSGAKAFLDAVKGENAPISDIIGQFGVGFYSAFMVADWIRVTSRSFKLDAAAATWVSAGSDTFEIKPAEKLERGTEVQIKIKDDCSEYLQENRIKEIVKKHSDFIPFPIYLGEGDKQQQINQQTALWRQNPRSLEEQQYLEFYKQLTFSIEPPLAYSHMVVEAPVQLYALLFVPPSTENAFASPRKEDGVKLYARKILIQNYCKELLPPFFRFVQGIVDSEDLPLNISRENVQSNRLMSQLNKLITNRVLEMLKETAKDKPDNYAKFWVSYGTFIKEGIATSQDFSEDLIPLLRFHTLNKIDSLVSLDQYITDKKEKQDKIYYILGEDEKSILTSPHLEALRYHGYDVILLTDPMDAFMLLRLNRFKDVDLVNVATQDLKLPENEKDQDKETNGDENEANNKNLIDLFKTQLGERVSDVHITQILVDSPARLVNKEGSLSPEVQRVFQVLNREYKNTPMVLEINPKHPILIKIVKLNPEDPVVKAAIEQVFENALWIEGLHPNPASMINRIHYLIETALKE